MPRLVTAAIVVSICTLALTTYTLVLVISNVTSLVNAFFSGLSEGINNLIMLLSPIMAVLSLMLSLVARREAESVLDTAVNYVEEFEGKISLAISYLALALSITSLILLLVQLVLSSLS